ncbi:MAG: glycerophosphodiester phosphodiesterase [Clostridia bacterium]|nr:glycerophosphodiester phosphodiesterase [Clostridia bacterium]
MSQYIFGHRGASGYAPENTLEAFELAAKMGAHGVELDVHICKSGELVVAHDETIDRVADGTGFIKDMTLSELKSHKFNKTHSEYKHATIPTLQEVFQLLKPYGMKINTELKNSYLDYPDLERRVVELADHEGMLDKIIFSSFSHRSMLRVKAIDKSLYCGLLYEASMIKPWAYAVALGMDAIHPHFTEVLLPGGECAAAHKAGIQVNPWTVNRKEDLEATLKEGADVLITNFPDVGLACLKAHEGK